MYPIICIFAQVLIIQFQIAMKCRLSIIIPIYKAEPFLIQCLDAIVNQSTQPYEVILVNDGSPDNCDVICNEYVERYSFFKYLKQDNQGVSVARNNGIALATGDYLTFCDPDDYYTQDFYEYISNIINNYQSDTYHFNYNTINESKVINQVFLPNTGDIKTYNIEDVLNGDAALGGLMVWRFIYRKSIIDAFDIKFPPGITISEDEIFNLRYFKHAKTFLHIDKVLYNYVFHENSIISQSYSTFIKKAIDSLYTNALTMIEESNGISYNEVIERIEVSIRFFITPYYTTKSIPKDEMEQFRLRLKHLVDTMSRSGLNFDKRFLLATKIKSRFFPIYRAIKQL